MMKFIYVALIALSFGAAIFTGKMSELSAAIFDGAFGAVSLTLTIAAAVCLWSGITRVAKSAGLVELLAGAFSPLTKFLFPGLRPGGKPAGLIVLNLASNMMGLGNASTPLGIAAMKELEAEETGKESGKENASADATDNMIMLTVLNAVSLQIIPATVAALRQKNGSSEPLSILPAVWLTSVCAAAASVAAVKVFSVLTKKGDNL